MRLSNYTTEGHSAQGEKRKEYVVKKMAAGAWCVHAFETLCPG